MHMVINGNGGGASQYLNSNLHKAGGRWLPCR
nr:MAG TPA: hypothetical protein [Caudoviricetes sp.]